MIEKTERCDGGCDKVLTSVRDEIYEPAVRIIIEGELSKEIQNGKTNKRKNKAS